MKKKINYGVMLRVIIDAFLLSSVLATSYLLRYTYANLFEDLGARAADVRVEYVRLLIYLPLIALFGLLSFAYFGLYSRTRTYNWRGKAFTVLKAVTIPYLLVPLTLFLIPHAPILPRSVLVIGWLLTLITVLSVRLWSILWRHILIKEESAANRWSIDDRKVLVIGGAGYIGSALIGKLLDNGYRVRLFDIFLYGREPIQEYLKHPNLEVIEGDFRQVGKVVEAMRNVASVVHLGGLVGDPACALDEQLTTEINLIATRVIAEVARGKGVKRFVFASTCSVYGASDGILDEKSSLNPVSLYARSKIASEQVLQEMRGPDFSPVILRFGTIFGLSGRTRFDLVVNLLAAKAVFDAKITLFGGDQWRPFVHVDDAARAVFVALEAPLDGVAGEIFNIGGNSLNYTLRDVGEMIQRMVPSAELLDLGANADRRNYRVDFSKAHNNLGYTPKWTLEEGIAQVIEAIRSGKVQDYTLAKYSNVKFLNDEKIRLLGKDGGWEQRVLAGIGEGM